MPGWPPLLLAAALFQVLLENSSGLQFSKNLDPFKTPRLFSSSNVAKSASLPRLKRTIQNAQTQISTKRQPFPIPHLGAKSCTSTNGFYIKSHSFLYYVQPNGGSWSAASNDCCRRNMSFAFLEYAAELHDLIAFTRTLPKSKVQWKFWVAAQGTAKGEFEWCHSRSKPSKLLALFTTTEKFERFGKPLNETLETCLHFQKTTAGNQLRGLACKENGGFVCQRPIYYPQSCGAFKCMKSSKQIKEAQAGTLSFNSSDIARTPKVPFYFNCAGKKYMVVIDDFEINGAFEYCCRRGLELISVKSKKEIKCLASFLATSSGSFWTSGMKTGDLKKSLYAFCGSRTSVKKSVWAEGQPEDPEGNRCVSLHFEKDVDRLTGLSSVHCGLVMPLICQFP